MHIEEHVSRVGTGRYATRRSRWLNAATQSMIAAPPVPMRMIRNVWARDHGPNCWYSMTERIAVQVNKVSQPDVPRPARSRRKEDETMKIRACCYAALVFVFADGLLLAENAVSVERTNISAEGIIAQWRLQFPAEPYVSAL